MTFVVVGGIPVVWVFDSFETLNILMLIGHKCLLINDACKAFTEETSNSPPCFSIPLCYFLIFFLREDFISVCQGSLLKVDFV